ncbi:MAG: serine/threonine protein kinase [Planctomycetaceae bacterium]|nr:serine/threonine protein kinase [Planctomycetaceae bacterium]
MVELLHAELEYRIKNGESRIVEDYHKWSAELSQTELLELIGAEYRLRRRAEPNLTDAEYFERFPDLHDQLATVLHHAPPSANREKWWSSETSEQEEFDETRVKPTVVDAARGLKAGATFAGYTILGEIARGGMGVVYKAQQQHPNRTVALKLIRSGQLADDEEISRFHLEAEAAANVDHPNIVPIYEVGSQDGLYFFSMRYVPGPSIASQVADGALHPERSAELLQTSARAVHFAHQNGIVHRDLKPSNILLDQDGHPHVTDFGLAKQMDADSGLTLTGQIIGTPAYMSPEQALGQTDQIGPLSDVYALGAVLYTTLTGVPAFQGASEYDTIRQVISDEPVAPRQLNAAIDQDLETICLKALQKVPSQRYSSAEEFADDLERWRSHLPISARPVTSFERSKRWCRRNPAVAVLMGSIGFLLLAITIGTMVAVSMIAASNVEISMKNDALERIAVTLGSQNDALKVAEEIALLAAEQAQVEREQAQVERRRAEDNLDAARSAVDRFFTQVSEDKLLNLPAFESLRRTLLSDAVGYYQNFAKEYSEDSGDEIELTMELAAAKFRVAQTIYEGDDASAVRCGIAVLEGLNLLEDVIDQIENSEQLGPLRNGVYKGRLRLPIGSDGNKTGKFVADRLLETADRACHLWERMLALDEESEGLRNDLAGLYNVKALIQNSAGSGDDALVTYLQAIDIWKDLSEADPTNPNYQSDMAIAYSNMSDIYKSRQDWEKAVEYELKTLAIQKEIRSKHDAFFVFDRSLTEYELGLLYDDQLGQDDKALEHFERARKGFDHLVSVLGYGDIRDDIARRITSLMVADESPVMTNP